MAITIIMSERSVAIKIRTRLLGSGERPGEKNVTGNSGGLWSRRRRALPHASRLQSDVPRGKLNHMIMVSNAGTYRITTAHKCVQQE